jgi:hypothetical protein
MSSFVLEEFVGNGVLKDQIDSLMADGWNDVPTLKIMSKDDMDTLQLSQLQRVRPSVPSLPVLDPANISSQSNKLWMMGTHFNSLPVALLSSSSELL